MTGIRLHNTRTRTKEDFAPLDPGNVRMYVCGPTVYDRAHLGNARPVIVFDVLFRLLRHVYGADHVTYVRNFTDVDDKINARAAEMRAAGDGRPLTAIIRALTDETIGWYHADMDALGALRPTMEPRATEWIGAMIAMIAGLIASGHAYEREGHVLFRVRGYKGYGKLSGRSVDDMIAGARVEVAPFKEDPMDFVLWKPSSDDLPGWESPWGRGRPGWHIECSAMSHELLGESFDIHGGGIDLQFPHHENEIAQSMCAHPEGGFAHYWMHNEMLMVEGRKMSKSLGNFFTVRDLLDRGIPGEVIRFVFLMTHYRSPMDWTEKKRQEADKRLDALLPAFRVAVEIAATPTGAWLELPEAMKVSLANDLNTSDAIVGLEMTGDFLVRAHRGEIVDESGAPVDLARRSVEFLNGLGVLGLYEALLRRRAAKDQARTSLDDWHLDFVIAYELAKQTKDFSGVDRRKKAFAEADVEVRISKDSIDLVPGPNFDPAKLEALK
ncbi:cysteine--tRNA ligase [Albidovulum sp.]|uniref:cysteine--tRNA ligase n=1 Tax=Albidovulum sp. TaxID=1872424 RepID=UPI0039B87398